MLAALLALAACYVALSAYLWRLQAAYPLHRRVASLLYPASQIVLVACAVVATRVTGCTPLFAWLALAAGAVCVPLDVALFRGLGTAERRDARAWRVRMLGEQLESQRVRYEQAAGLAREADRIEREVADRLRDVADAVAREDTTRARELVGRAIDVVPSRGDAYCRNLAVDALLAFKQAQCEQEGIDLDIRAAVPEELGLPSAEVCAVLSNLLDNAMSACGELPAAERWVALSARVLQGHLVIGVENPCVAGGRAVAGGGAHDAVARGASALPEHGWGLSIVSEICRAHGGELFIEQEEGCYRVRAVLRTSA